MIKLIIFDFDGTLADTRKFVMDIVEELQPKYSYGIPPQQAIHSKHIFSILREDLRLPLWKIPFFVHDVKKRFFKTSRKASLYPGIAPMLKRLSASCVVGIVTSNDAEAVHVVFRRHRVKGVSFVQGRAPLFGKHRIFRKIMRQRRLAPSEVIYVGDELRDVIAARRARIKSAAVLWGYNSPKSLRKEHPDMVCKTSKDLMNILAV